MSALLPPAVVEITVRYKGNEITVRKIQATDRLGRPIERAADTMRKAAADAQAWIRRNA